MLQARHAAFCSCAGVSNTSGRASLRYIRRAFGMPFSRHCETAAFVTSHSSATFTVPPRLSMIWLLLSSMRKV